MANDTFDMILSDATLQEFVITNKILKPLPRNSIQKLKTHKVANELLHISS